MKNLKYQVQKTSKNWTDETGIAIPFNRLTKAEKTREKIIGKLLKDALKINEHLEQFKNYTQVSVEEIRDAIYENVKLPKKSKGNFTFYNFDRSIKVEVNVNETIRFDDSLIAAAREYLDKFIEKNVTGTDEVVRTLINSAFHDTKGGLDAKKVLSLLKYRTKIKAGDFQKALSLIEQSISRPTSRKYFRIWVQDNQGKYQNVELNFSSI